MIPACWKRANVTPVYKKKGGKTNPENYRPISLLSILIKIMEKLIRDEMVMHLSEHKLLSIHQHGFMRGKSCVTNLLESLDIITEALNRGFSAVVVFLDFSKAFDRVSHKLLKIKLKSYGFTGKLLAWLENFLQDRKQRVVIGQYESDWVDVLSGVPQGSVLGPLLFLIFINDLPELVSHFCKLFADDSKLISVIRNTSDQMLIQDDIDKMVEWSKRWSMEFNESKCKVMYIGNSKIARQKISMLNADGLSVELAETTTERDLGVMVNNKLKWNDQIDNCVNKANNMLGMLKKTFVYWDAQSFLQLYKTYVRPHLEYCVPAWNPYLKKDILKLEQVQRRATKLVPQIRSLNYESRLANLGLETLKDRRERGDLIQFYKIDKKYNHVNWYYDAKLMSSVNNEGPSGGVRGAKHRICSQLTKCEARRNFLPNRVVNNWNALPTSIVTASSTNHFKNRLDNVVRNKKNEKSTIAGLR
jgi:hypothetical protein